MKQVYATQSAGQEARVVAASAGLGPDALAAVLAAVSPPADGRLALLDTPAGRLLVHTVRSGELAVTHALVDVPASADALSAIQTWGSRHWQRTPPDAASDLHDLPYLPVADVLDDAGLQAWLSTPARRELVEFAFAALLTAPPGERVVLPADSEDAARVVYAVARGLPAGLLDDLTFSTAGPPDGRAARLAAVDPAVFPPDPDPAPRPAVPFAEFAAAAIAAGEFSKLDDLKALWQRLGLTDPRHFDLVYRLGRGAGVLTKEEAAEAVRQPALAAWLSARTDAVNQLLDWALDDRSFASDAFSRVVQTLRQRPEVLAKLGDTVRLRGVQALREGDRDRTANALEVVLPMVAPAKAGTVWGELVGQFPDPDALPWEMRTYLLPRFARYRQQQGVPGVDPDLLRWLSVPTDKLADLLKLDLPRPYHLAAGRACLLRAGEPTDELARTLGAVPTVALTLLRPEATDDAHPVPLFDKLLAQAPNTPWLDEVVGAGDDFPADTRNRFLVAALDADAVDAERLVRTRGPRLLELFAGRSGLDRLAARFLQSPPDDLLRPGPLADFLDKLAPDPQTNGAVKARVDALRTVREFLLEPGFAPDRLAAVADAFRVSPPALPPAARAAVFEAVAAELGRRTDGDGFQADLEATLAHLGGVLATDPADLCENLLRDLRARTDLTRQPGPTAAFLAVALGAAKTPALEGKLDGLDGPAFALAADAARRGGSRLLAEVDRRTADWPRSAKAQWGFLRTAVRPQGAKRYLRDLEFFVLGACGATIAWYAYTQLGR